VAGGDWPGIVDRLIHKSLAEDEAEREAGLKAQPPGMVMLTDLHAIWPGREPFMPTRELVGELIVHNPDYWGAQSAYGKPLTETRLGRLVTQAAKVTSVRIRGVPPRGYLRSQLQPVWRRLGIAPSDEPDEPDEPGGPDGKTESAAGFVGFADSAGSKQAHRESDRNGRHPSAPAVGRTCWSTVNTAATAAPTIGRWLHGDRRRHRPRRRLQYTRVKEGGVHISANDHPDQPSALALFRRRNLAFTCEKSGDDDTCTWSNPLCARLPLQCM
jgi:Protein of unknown function (DUF3631)